MMRGRGLGRRRVGLARTVGRTALIAGTATAVAGSVAGRQQQAAGVANAAPPEIPPDNAPEAAPAAGFNDQTITHLKQLGELHQNGVLTDEEFAAQKAKLLNA